MPKVKYGDRILKFPDGMSEVDMESAILELDAEPAEPTTGSRGTVRSRLEATRTLQGKPVLITDEVRREALERKYGYIAEDGFSPRTMIENVPRNIEDIVSSIGSMMAGTAIFAYKFGRNLIKDWNDFASEPSSTEYGHTFLRVRDQFSPITDLGKAVYYDWKAMFAGEVSDEIGKLPVGRVRDAIWEKVERQGLSKTVRNFIQDCPVDSMLLGTSVYRLLAAGSRTSLELAKDVDKVVNKAPGVVGKIDSILSTRRSPIVYDLGEISDLPPRHITFPREYSKDPLTKYIFQKSFDAALEKFPKMGESLARHKAKKLLNTLRNTYEDLTFEERTALHSEVFKNINGLSKSEQDILVPYLEGRAQLIDEPSEKFRAFENWYRNLISGINDELILRGKLTPEIIQNRLYQPMVKASGRSMEEVIAEMGDFKPVYVHHMFPKIYKEKTGIHFAETTGRRFKPGFLKKSEGVGGYTHNLKEILPKFTNEYIKFKNTEAYLREFTNKFGIRVNIRDIKPVEGGLKVVTEGVERFFPDHVIIAPDGYLNFYKGKIDIYKEISKAMENSTFDEAIGNVLAEIEGFTKTYIGVSKNRTVYLVPREMSEELSSFATPIFGSSKAQDVIRVAVDKPTQVWKDMVLAASPRWVKNNVVGDIVFNTLEGVGPMSYSRSFRAIYRDTIPDELLKASFANIMKYNPHLGKTADTAVGQMITRLEGTKVARGLSVAKDKLYALNTMFEQPFVRSLYVSLARKKAIALLKEEGLRKTEVNILNKMRTIKADPNLSAPIIERVKETLPVFNLTGSQERKYIRRLIPFINWYKFMIQYGAKLPAKHPFLTVGGRGLGALSESQREEVFKDYFPFMIREIEEGGIPKRFTNLWPVGEKGGKMATFFNTRGMNPFAVIEDIASLDVMPMLSPVITVPYEQITGKSAFGDREFVGPETGIHYTAEGRVEYADFEKVRPPLWDHILRQLPQYELAKQILVPAKQFDTGTILNPDPRVDPITGEYKYPIDSVEKILNVMGIDKKTLDIHKVWNVYLARKRNAMNKAITRGIAKDYLSFEDIRGAFESIVGDEKKMKQIRHEMEVMEKLKREETEELLRKMEEEESSSSPKKGEGS